MDEMKERIANRYASGSVSEESDQVAQTATTIEHHGPCE